MMSAERRRIEETLRQTESHLNELLNNMPSGVTVYEPVDRGSDFLIKSLNKASERIDGFKREEFLGRRLSRVFPQAREMGLLKVLRRVQRTGKPEKLPATYYAGGRKPGWRENYVYRLPSGEVVSVYRDVSEYVRVGELFRRAFHLSPSAMTLTAIEDGRIIDANEEFLRMIGHRREEVVGRRTVDLGVWEDRAERAEVQARVLRDGKARNVEITLRSKCGARVSALWSGDIVEMEGRSCLLGAAVDLTEFKKTERVLIQAQRLASVGQLAAGVAHEINNPLAALSGEIQWLKTKSRDRRVRKSLEFMDKVSRRIAVTVTHLLTFSRQAPPDARRPTSVNALVGRVLALVERRLEAQKVRLERRLGLRLPLLRLNRGQVEQVLMNVLSNSLDATPRGGRLSIETRCDPSRRVVAIVIQDTGRGIPAADLPKVFDPFFTTKPPGKGVGLGLSVSHGIVIGHGGRIDVSSGPGRGARVLIEFPVSR